MPPIADVRRTCRNVREVPEAALRSRLLHCVASEAADTLIADEFLDNLRGCLGRFERWEVAYRLYAAHREPWMLPGEGLLCREVLGRTRLRIHVQRRHRRAQSAERLERITFACIRRSDLACPSCPIRKSVATCLLAHLLRHRGGRPRNHMVTSCSTASRQRASFCNTCIAAKNGGVSGLPLARMGFQLAKIIFGTRPPNHSCSKMAIHPAWAWVRGITDCTPVARMTARASASISTWPQSRSDAGDRPCPRQSIASTRWRALRRSAAGAKMV